jgi:hypothetical protein
MDPRLRERLEAERRRLEALDTRAAWLPIHHALNREQHALSIDVESADRILDGLSNPHCRLCQSVLVGYLQRRTFRFSVGSTGRVFNSFSNLKTELRSAVRLAGEPIGNVDLVCSQPALLAVEMLLQNPTNGVKGRATYMDSGADSPLPPPCPCPAPDSASPFLSLVLSGQLYEFLAAKTGLSRDTVKLSLLRDVLAKKGRYPSAMEEVFRREFPEVYAYVRRVNRDDHAELIRRLQRLESRLVIHRVCPTLIGRIPIITLHDSIYSRVDGLAVVETAFEEVFRTMGFRLSLKREGSDE